MAELLSGAPVSAAIAGDLKSRADRLREHGLVPRLALLRLGERPDDLSYERSIARFCGRVGAEAVSIALPENCSQTELKAQIEAVNARTDIHGALLLRPLPETLDEFAACETLSPEKDVDGMGSRALGALFAGRKGAFAPCTARACLELLDYYGYGVEGKHALVIGRGLVAGRPVGQLLLQRNATVTLCHSHTNDLPALCREADILVAAAGKPGLVGAEHVRAGQIVLDVGTTAADGTLLGDVRLDEVAPVVRAVTPVPGGVGAVTTAVLIRHVIESAEQ